MAFMKVLKILGAFSPGRSKECYNKPVFGFFTLQWCIVIMMIVMMMMMMMMMMIISI